MDRIIVNKIETPLITTVIYNDGIGHMHFHDNATIDVPEQMEHLENLKKITEGKSTPFVVTAGNNVTITKEARDNAILIEDLSPLNATAVVVQNFAYKLIADFYLKINKPKQPYQVFSDVEKAFEWCKKYLK